MIADLFNHLSEDIPKRPVFWAEALFSDVLFPSNAPIKIWRGQDGRPGQAGLLDASFKYRKVVCHSGHCVGKTFLIVCIVLLWIFSRPSGVKSYIIVTSDAWSKVRTLFNELRRATRKLNEKYALGLPIPLANCSWFLGNTEVIGLSPSEVERFQGWHAPGGVLIVGDESSHLSYEQFEAMRGSQTGELDRLILFGNPIHADGPFIDCMIAAEKGATDDPNYEPWFGVRRPFVPLTAELRFRVRAHRVRSEIEKTVINVVNDRRRIRPLVETNRSPRDAIVQIDPRRTIRQKERPQTAKRQSGTFRTPHKNVSISPIPRIRGCTRLDL